MGTFTGNVLSLHTKTKPREFMKITITTKDINSKDEGASRKAYLCFRIREKNTDIKVRSDIEVLAEYWNNDTLSYRRTKAVPSDEQKRVKSLVRSIIDTLDGSFNADTADVPWVKSVIEGCITPTDNANHGLTTVIDRMEQYLAEHPMDRRSALAYIPTVKKLRRYEAFKREMEGKDGFALYCETIRPEDYLDFREYVINEHTYYNDYPEFYEQFHLESHPPRQMSGTGIIDIMHHLRIVGHWCIRMGYTTNRSCDAFTIPAAVHGTPYYLTLEERDRVFHADLSRKPELQVYRDLFMFQSLVGCRAGDMFSLTPNNVTGDILQYLPHKTMRKRSQTVSVPLNTKALAILERYMGQQEKLLPTKQIARYNEGIRKVLKYCGIDRMVTILDTVTGKEVQKPICDVATSHMARRNFIGNLYKQVKDPDLISSMTGHVNGSRAFARYRDIDEDTKISLVNLIN